jgi:uncharacterized protein (TIGR03083 family)
VSDEGAAVEPVIALLAETWTSIAQLGDQLDEGQWGLATDCPGWSVKDNLSHLIGTERMLLGEPADPLPVDRADHVKNDVGAFNEAAVVARRARPGAEVLAEFRSVTAARLEALRDLPATKWDEIGPTPTGQGPYRQFMMMRLFDSWVHEQDMRRAVGAPGHVAGAAVDAVLAWHRRNIGYVVGKKAHVPEGTTVQFDLTDAPQSSVTVTVTDGRAHVLDDPSGVTPTTVVRLDVETFNALLCGRWDADSAIADGRVTLDRDVPLGEQVTRAMNYLF